MRKHELSSQTTHKHLCFDSGNFGSGGKLGQETLPSREKRAARIVVLVLEGKTRFFAYRARTKVSDKARFDQQRISPCSSTAAGAITIPFLSESSAEYSANALPSVLTFAPLPRAVWSTMSSPLLSVSLLVFLALSASGADVVSSLSCLLFTFSWARAPFS